MSIDRFMWTVIVTAVLFGVTAMVGVVLAASEPTQVLPSNQLKQPIEVLIDTDLWADVDANRLKRLDMFVVSATQGMLASNRFNACDAESIARQAWNLAEWLECERARRQKCPSP